MTIISPVVMQGSHICPLFIAARLRETFRGRKFLTHLRATLVRKDEAYAISKNVIWAFEMSFVSYFHSFDTFYTQKSPGP